jgi:hypothetical protein
MVALLAGSAFAGVTGAQNIIKQRAKELNDQNNVRQGVAPPTQPVTQPAAAPKSPPPAPPAALTQFQTELAAIKAGASVTEQQRQKLASSLMAVAQGAKPSQGGVAKFIEDLVAAAVDKPLSPESRARLVQELDAVLNPGKYPQAKLDGIFADVQAIFQDQGLMRPKAVALADGVKAMSADIQKGGAK